MKKILVATDFSKAALNAAAYAIDMAAAINAKIHLLHAYQLPIIYSEMPPFISVNDMEQMALNEMETFKTQLLEKQKPLIAIETEVRMGGFFPELKFVCDQIKPYAVVIGSQGKTATERFFFGSNATYTARHLAWPLVTVPMGVKFSSIKKIGLACDLEKVADSIPINEIKELVKDFNATFHILNISEAKINNPCMIFESGMMQEMMAELNPKYHFIYSDQTDEAIINFAVKNDIDLLLVIPKRHNLMDRLMYRSLSRAMVLHSHVPVMSLHHFNKSFTVMGDHSS